MSDDTGGSAKLEGPKTSLWEKLVTMILNAPWASILSIIVVVGAMLFVAKVITGDGQHNDIRDTEYARGFITVLFGVGTIGIALLVTLSAIFLTDQNAKERFDRGKEVLSLLLGIFGTIIGFYYGTGATKSGNVTANQAPPPAAASPAPAVRGVGSSAGSSADSGGKGEEATKAMPQKSGEPPNK